jgi:hypothetical protein
MPGGQGNFAASNISGTLAAHPWWGEGWMAPDHDHGGDDQRQRHLQQAGFRVELQARGSSQRVVVTAPAAGKDSTADHVPHSQSWPFAARRFMGDTLRDGKERGSTKSAAHIPHP